MREVAIDAEALRKYRRAAFVSRKVTAQQLADAACVDARTIRRWTGPSSPVETISTTEHAALAVADLLGVEVAELLVCEPQLPRAGARLAAARVALLDDERTAAAEVKPGPADVHDDWIEQFAPTDAVATPRRRAEPVARRVPVAAPQPLRRGSRRLWAAAVSALVMCALVLAVVLRGAPAPPVAVEPFSVVPGISALLSEQAVLVVRVEREQRERQQQERAARAAARRAQLQRERARKAARARRAARKRAAASPRSSPPPSVPSPPAPSVQAPVPSRPSAPSRPSVPSSDACSSLGVC